MNTRIDPGALMAEAAEIDLARVFGGQGRVGRKRPKFAVELIPVGRRFRRVMVVRGARFDYPISRRRKGR